MHSLGARLLAVAVVGALFASVTSDLRGVRSLPLLLLALAVVSLGIAGVLHFRADPMPTPFAWAVAATGPVACLLTCLAIPGPLDNPNQSNAHGAGVAVCAFLCVRGRTVTAWCSFSTMVAVLAMWSIQTRQGLYGLLLSAPNAAVLGMATLFAVVVRPAAATIRQLREASLDQAEKLAAARARIVERDRQRSELRRVAWPTLRRIAGGEPFTALHAADIRLTEAQLRDSVRARSFTGSPVVEAARAARSRGVAVVLFDDGGMDAAQPGVGQVFCQLAAESLERTVEGSVTVRIHPPDRPLVGSIVAIRGDGTSRRLDVDASGAVHSL